MPEKNKETVKPTPEAGKEPEGKTEEGKTEEGKTQEPKTIEDFKKLSEDQTSKLDQFGSDLKEATETIETQGGRIESLQDSLESAMEELTLKKTPAPATPAPTPEKKPEEKTEETKPEGTEAKAPEKPAGELEEKLQEAVDDDKEFREETILRHEISDLKEEMTDALKKYPQASEKDIYLGIEDGLEEDNPNQVEVLAKASHEGQVVAKEKLTSEIKEDLKVTLKKEAEGGHSLPQSQGTPSTSEKPQKVAAIPESQKLNTESEWDDALTKAKAEGASEE